MSIIRFTKNYALHTYGTSNIEIFLNDLTKDNVVIDTELKRLSDAAQVQETETDSLESRIETVEDTVSTFTEEVTKQIDDFTNTVNEDIAGMHTELNEFDARLSKNESDIASLKPENIADLENRVTIAEQQIANNAELIKGITSRLDDDEENLSQHAIRLDALERENESNQTAISDLTNNFNEFQDNTNESISTITAEITGIKGNLESTNREVASLQSAVEGSQVSIQTINEQIQTLSNQVTNLNDRLSFTENKVINLDERVKKLEEKP